MNVAWFEHSAITDTVLVATGSAFHPVLLCPGNVVRLPKFSLDSQHTVTERDVALAQIYGENCVLFLKHQLHGSVSVTVEIVIYTVTRSAPTLCVSSFHLLLFLSLLYCIHYQRKENN